MPLGFVREMDASYFDDVIINVNCRCGETFMCDPHFAGRKVRCPVCGETALVPDLMFFDVARRSFFPVFNGNARKLNNYDPSNDGIIHDLEKYAAERTTAHEAQSELEQLSKLALEEEFSDSLSLSESSEILPSVFEQDFSSSGFSPEEEKTVSIPAVLRAANPLAKRSKNKDKCDVNNYRLVSQIAQGGMGKVSLARDVLLERTVVVKELREKYRDNPDFQRRLVVEAKISGFLDHPGIVPVYSLETDEQGRPFYVMRRVAGVTLEEAIEKYHIRREESRLKDLLRSFISACQTIDYAHSVGIVHRDIKPTNIMIGRFGATFVMDWGLAVKISDADNDAAGKGESAEDDLQDEPEEEENVRLTNVNMRVGTPWYRDPVYLKTGISEPSNDVFSLGVVLYKILTNKLPWFSKTTGERTAILLEEAVPPVELKSPESLSAICMKAIEKDPANRYPNVGRLADDVRRWLENEPISVFKESFIKRIF